jgi:hypothetical protein
MATNKHEASSPPQELIHQLFLLATNDMKWNSWPSMFQLVYGDIQDYLKLEKSFILKLQTRIDFDLMVEYRNSAVCKIWLV